ncbi:ATP-dependent zinc protease family protein [Oceanobacter mangrovi]|uniref:ATP-dependent zinc protease family protein n=1 Tax=Oceanobacter mangrovi TaxID=2862510 RepID=UPI001C8D60D9|nr:ATP-dependent zinc protease [Oceanobacter mangrovi]
MDKIEAVVSRNQPRIELTCPDISSVSEQLQQQRRQLKSLTRQLGDVQQTLEAEQPVCEPQPAEQNELDGRLIVGATEWIYLAPPGHHYRARIDSGATTSSLSARNIVRFERNGEPWVRFQLQHDDEAEPIEIEAPVVRNVLIRQSSADEADRRPVIELTVHIGQTLQQQTEFTLTDRSHMTYPILLGRSFLRDITLIDVGKQFLNEKYHPNETVVPVEKNPS